MNWRLEINTINFANVFLCEKSLPVLTYTGNIWHAGARFHSSVVAARLKKPKRYVKARSQKEHLLRSP